MDLNSDDIETSEEKGEFSKSEELVIQVVCYLIFALPTVAILKVKVYDKYMPVVSEFFKGILA